MLVFAPPGSGKSTWAGSRPGWADQDMLYAHLHDETWHAAAHTQREEREHYARIDRRLEVDRHRLNVIGCLFWDAVPDAVVMPPPAVHRQRIAGRADLRWPAVAKTRATLAKVAAANNVPVFPTFEALEASRVYHRDIGAPLWYKRVERGPYIRPPTPRPQP